MTSKLLLIFLTSIFLIPFRINSQWIKTTDFAGKLFGDLYFINADTGFLAGGVYEDPDLCRTYDGGETWDTIGSEIEGPIQSICFINDSVGFISCGGMYPNDYIYKTVNQGENWYVVYEHPLMTWDISFPTENVGYAIPTITENALITKTVDGGESWNIINSIWIEWGGFGAVDFQFLTENLGYVIFESGVIYKTIDGGMNFNEMYLDYNFNLNSVCFLNADTGFVAGEFKNPPFMNDTGGVILKTMNGGIDWQVDSLPGMCKSVYFINPDTGYIAAEDFLLETHDAGETWQVCEGYFMYLLNSVFGADKNTVYALSAWDVGPGFSALYKLDFKTGIENPADRKSNFSVYPNPAKDFIIVKIFGEKGTDCRICIYNQLGEKVLFTDTGNSRINFSSLQPGIYFVEVSMHELVSREKILICR